MTPSGEKSIETLDTPSALAALQDLSPFAKYDDVASRLHLLEIEIARRLNLESRNGGSAIAEALGAMSPELPIVQSVKRTARTMKLFDEVHPN